MESDRAPEAPLTAELRERERVIARSAVAPHLDGSGVSWWLVVAGSVLNTLVAGLLYLIIREDQMWLLWVLTLVPLAAPLGWSAGSRLVRRRNGVAPASVNQPRYLKRVELRLALWSLPLELGILVLVALAPAVVVITGTFVASVAVFGAICHVYARKVRGLAAAA
jgi:hypothetical protein